MNLVVETTYVNFTPPKNGQKIVYSEATFNKIQYSLW